MSHIANAIVLFGMITMSIQTSGACLNPAIGLVQSYYQHIVVEHFKSQEMDTFSKMIVKL